MNDRELLELAAKAHGLSVAKFQNVEHPKGSGCHGAFYCYSHYWNPLTDDGDALRLAVSCSLGVSIVNNSKRTDVVTFLPNQALIGVCEWHDNDRSAATRRAIVRAAAEIGRTTTESVR